MVLLAGRRTWPGSRRRRSSLILRAPQWFVALEADDQAVDLAGQLVGIAHERARAIAEGGKAMLLVAVKVFVASFA